MKLPKARNQNIVTQEIGDEILIYDLVINQAYSLNQTSSIVFQHCDGKTTFVDLKARHDFSDELIYLALDQLKKENLLEKDANFLSPFTGLSRREIVKKIGLTSMAALPVIGSIVAPTPAQAASGCAPGLFAPGQTSLICAGDVGDCVAHNGCGPGFPGFDAPAACCSGMATIGVCTPQPVPPGGEACPCICS